MDETGNREGSSTAIPRLHQSLTERPREVAPPQDVVVSPQGWHNPYNICQALTKEANDTELTDYEYDSHSSQETDIHWQSGDEVPISDRRVINEVDVGEAICFAFPVDMDYDVNDECHMFDEDLSDDESSDSDRSSNYEELMDIEAATRVLIIQDLEGQNDDFPSGDSLVDGDEEYDTEQNYVDGIMPSSEDEMSITGDTSGTESAPAIARVPVPKTLDEIQKAFLQMKKEEEARDRLHWKVKELQEMFRELERQIPEAESHLEAAAKRIEVKKESNKATLEVSGISPQLFEAYEEFCESLHPEFGLRDGFSITCDIEHCGSYVQYDPEFGIFKDCVEIDYKMCNFRSEASDGKVVEFWPVRCPEPLTGVETTWGEQYPELYELALQAARQGSEPAMEMLVKLPGANASLGGWLFEYRFEDLLKSDPTVSRRWDFHSAHEIDRPLSVEEKKYRLSLQIQTTA